MMNRHTFLKLAGSGVLGISSVPGLSDTSGKSTFENFQRKNGSNEGKGAQRLTEEDLRNWQKLKYGMFIHFGMSTFTGDELDKGNSPAKLFNPTRLDVAQWVSVARDAGMTYAVLTAKHVAGHCLWKTAHTPYSIVNSGNTTDIVEVFVNECRKKGIRPGLYYCSWDNHNRFGSQTPSDHYKGEWNDMNYFPQDQEDGFAPYTTSLYQNFQTAQITELLTRYGEIMELWIDIPGLLGKGYRSYLYQYATKLQPAMIVMMNCGLDPAYNADYAFPSDIRAFERNLPANYNGWLKINDKDYYLPGEFCQPIGKQWFYADGDLSRSKEELSDEYQFCRKNDVNYLLDVPPDKSGQLPGDSVKKLMELKKMIP
jgi:alpha-L-fucosidase